MWEFESRKQSCDQAPHCVDASHQSSRLGGDENVDWKIDGETENKMLSKSDHITDINQWYDCKSKNEIEIRSNPFAGGAGGAKSPIGDGWMQLKHISTKWSIVGGGAGVWLIAATEDIFTHLIPCSVVFRNKSEVPAKVSTPNNGSWFGKRFILLR